MADEIVRLPYNPQGNLPAARVSEEPITVRPSTGEGFNFYVPKYAPYFRNGFKLYNPDTNAYLVEGVDYIHTHAFNAMSQLVGLELYGSIMFIDREFSGNLQCSYYSLGGEFTLDARQMLEMLARNLVDPRTTYWERVADTPVVFPPISHQHNIATDTMTWDDVVEAIESLKDPFSQGLNLAMQAVTMHSSRQDNPHVVTKAQVGLGLVQNYRLAVEADLEGAGENLYMTLAMTRKMIASLGGDSAAAHIANRNNPHYVTKAQVGLGSVDNFATATDSEMRAATVTNKFTTPAGVMVAIKSVTDTLATRITTAEGSITQHVTNTNNPHGVTKAQVGLSNVLNYGVATESDAVTGSVDNLYMTPLKTKQAIDAVAGTALTRHIADISNPHQVTASQVGLGQVLNYPVATRNEAIAGLAGDRYMTPVLVRYAIETLAGEGFGQHIADYNNPHQVTKEQVGLDLVMNYGIATEDDVTDSSSNELYMTPFMVKKSIELFAGDGFGQHMIDYDNPHRVTAEQIGLGLVMNYGMADDALATDATSNTAYMSPYTVGIAITALAAAIDHTHNPLDIGALPIRGGQMTGDLLITRLTDSTGVSLVIDGPTAGITAFSLKVNTVEASSIIESSVRVGTVDSADNTENFMDTVGDITGSQWVNSRSVDPVEDPDDPWPTDDQGVKIPPKKVGKLSDYLNNDFVDKLVTDSRLIGLIQQIIADYPGVISAQDFEIK